jgi:hypothetical protein
MMRHGRLSHHRNHAQAVAAFTGAFLLAGGGAVASADAPRNSEHLSPAELAQKVAAATDARLVIVERQQVTSTDATVIDSDARKQIAAEYMGSKLYSGDIKGTWFAAASRHCYSTTNERFVGLTSIGMSLLPQGSVAAQVKVSYRQVGPRALRWKIAATSQHGVEQGTVWFSARDVIVKSQTRAYKSGSHGTAQAATVTLTYPKTLPATVPSQVPRPVCKAKA